MAKSKRRITRSSDPSVDQPPLPPHLVDAMLSWYGEMRRDLPWRRTRDPYAILISEIMLQQTRVETVINRYESFLERFPTIANLAAASLDDVLAEWSGLGYYRRPRLLHALANAVIDNHDGEIPDTLEELLALPGLGLYTSAAVGSIAFGIPALSIDGNVGRIMCRLANIEEDFRRPSVRRRLEAMTVDAIHCHPPGEVNQAIMELGARVCTPRSPRCDECPCSSHCEARALGIEELIPPTRHKQAEAVTEYAAVIENEGRLLMLRGQRPSLVPDMWEFPTLDSRLADTSSGRPAREPASCRSRTLETKLGRYLKDLGWSVRLGPKLGEVRHGMTNRRISCHVYEARLSGTPSAATQSPSPVHESDPSIPDSGWFTIEEVMTLALAASARKTLTTLLKVDLTTPQIPR
jgi:A/G-specific adenine glycosylase